jgi:hypothetical protein
MDGIVPDVIDNIIINLGSDSGSVSVSDSLPVKIQTEEVSRPPGNEQVNMFWTGSSHVSVQPTLNPLVLLSLHRPDNPGTYLPVSDSRGQHVEPLCCAVLCEISSSHGGEYDVQSCLLGCTAV